MELIQKYFPDITEQQREQYAMLYDLYADWNAKINVISRKDIENLYEHHVLHSLAIAKLLRFRPGTAVLDLGTGGGFPGIPLAIMFPDARFKLIDGTGKKILVTREIAKALGLKNCEAVQLRGEEERGKYDFVVSRAVMKLPELVRLVKKNIGSTQRNSIVNGLICLKGGDVSGEIAPFRHIAEVTDIGTMFSEEWFKEKNLVYIPL